MIWPHPVQEYHTVLLGWSANVLKPSSTRSVCFKQILLQHTCCVFNSSPVVILAECSFHNIAQHQHWGHCTVSFTRPRKPVCVSLHWRETGNILQEIFAVWKFALFVLEFRRSIANFKMCYRVSKKIACIIFFNRKCINTDDNKNISCVTRPIIFKH